MNFMYMLILTYINTYYKHKLNLHPKDIFAILI